MATETFFKKLFFLPALMAALGLIPAGQASPQTFTTLHDFSALNNNTNSDGANPRAGLTLSGNILFGTAYSGGISSNGTAFAVNINGTGFSNLHSFSRGFDGGNPTAGVILSGNTLYGTAQFGGNSGKGIVFRVDNDGSGFTNLHSFTATSSGNNSDGANPQAKLILSGDTLYGTAAYGGSSGGGAVFAVHTDGTGFTNLHSFTEIPGSTSTNNEGFTPSAGLILSGNTLYGTAQFGGRSGVGTVFAINTNGTGFTTLHSFANSPDAARPICELVLSGNTLYGTANGGGSFGRGTIFAINADGTGFTNLYKFKDIIPTNSGGAVPQAGLILLGDTLYGTAQLGGSSGKGTIFAIKTNGTGFATMHNFTATSGPSSTNTGGANPYGRLILSGNTLYGTARTGGSSGNGTIFSLSLSGPQLSVTRSGANIILNWPTNPVGFFLQFTTNVISPAAWNTNPSGPSIVNGQNTMTNSPSGPQKFYRLIQ